MAHANSFVEDVVLKVDQALDRVQLNLAKSLDAAPDASDPLYTSIHALSAKTTGPTILRGANHTRANLPAEHAVKAVSKPSPSTIRTANKHDQPLTTKQDQHRQALTWLAIGKATAQTYGAVLDALLRRLVPLDEELTYWTSTLDSSRHTAFYTLQTAPLRLWTWSSGVLAEARASPAGVAAHGWRDFYSVVRGVARARSLADARASVAVPGAAIRAEILGRIDALQRGKAACAASIGLLLSYGFRADSGAQGFAISGVNAEGGATEQEDEQLRGTIAQAVRVMGAVLDVPVPGAADASNAWRADLDALASESSSSADALVQQGQGPHDPAKLRAQLAHILGTSLPAHERAAVTLLRTAGRPSAYVRLWPFALAGVLFGSTALRVAVGRRAALATWARDAIDTARAFWANWVVGPAMALVATIRHDDAAEVRLTSRQSLEGDRSSLERMVLDFVRDHPESVTAPDASPAAAPPTTNSSAATGAAAEEALRASIRDGDLTPILRSYEHDIASSLPIALFRGTLIRSLLIQVQKTKVDVALAMRGIDALLQSQQLVFGLASLTPGVAVLVLLGRGALRFVQGPGEGRRRRGREGARKAYRGVQRVLDGVATASSGSAESLKTLAPEPFGLLIADAVLLREEAAALLPAAEFREFCTDFGALVDVRAGVEAQGRAVRRMRWAYKPWL